jgi:signal peptidase I
MHGESNTLLLIAAALALLSGLFIAYCAATRGDDARDATRRGMLEIAWPLFFVTSLGMLLTVTDFSAILLLATVITGIIWGIDHWFFRPRRQAGAGGTAAPEPVVVDMARAFFPVVAVVFMIRSFWVEPFKIPSGSMKPTLTIGDFILVNKYTYGLRLPVLNKKVTDGTPVARGDVVVFRYPNDPQKDYIKRIIGIPGDRIEYRDKRLLLNGAAIPLRLVGIAEEGGLASYSKYQVLAEKLGANEHLAQVRDDRPPVILSDVGQFPFRNNCEYNDSGFRCNVPPGQYFVMGDNRDESLDSRYWGFVPDDHMKGRAFLVWMNFSDFKRVGTRIE